MKEVFKGKLSLTQKASESLHYMVNELKEENPYIKISPSRVASWIIDDYVKNRFSSEMPKIIESHFDHKRYLTEILKTAKTGDEIKALFQANAFRINGGLTPPKKKATKPIGNKQLPNALFQAKEYPFDKN